jgi:hypothetical protein
MFLNKSLGKEVNQMHLIEIFSNFSPAQEKQAVTASCISRKIKQAVLIDVQG